jgi:transposase
LIGMEACGGAHFRGRALRGQGHDVRLMPAQYVGSVTIPSAR